MIPALLFLNARLKQKNVPIEDDVWVIYILLCIFRIIWVMICSENLWVDLGINILGEIVFAGILFYVFWFKLTRKWIYGLFRPIILKITQEYKVIHSEIYDDKNVFKEIKFTLILMNIQHDRNFAFDINSFESSCLIKDKIGNNINDIPLELIPTKKTLKLSPIVLQQKNDKQELKFKIKRSELQKLKNLNGYQYILVFRFVDTEDTGEESINETDITQLVEDYKDRKSVV